MYVPIGSQTPSAQAMDLGQRIADTVRSYLANNPGIGAGDVTQAFGVARQLLRDELGGVAPQTVAIILAAMMGVLVLGIFVALQLNGGWDTRFPAISIAIVVIAIGGLVAAIARNRM